MGLYSKTGDYSGYDKNNKERDALDYYSTPTEEVTNILDTLNIDFNNTIILESGCGGGHMVQGILDYITNNPLSMKSINLITTDIQDRGNITSSTFLTGKEYAFIASSEIKDLDSEWLMTFDDFSKFLFIHKALLKTSSLNFNKISLQNYKNMI